MPPKTRRIPQPERRVWIAQCLCPQRHCILTLAGEADHEHGARERVLESLREAIAELIDKRTINPSCGICRARADTWYYEIGRTKFAAVEAAEPILRETQALNVLTAAMLSEPGPGNPH